MPQAREANLAGLHASSEIAQKVAEANSDAPSASRPGGSHRKMSKQLGRYTIEQRLGRTAIAGFHMHRNTLLPQQEIVKDILVRSREMQCNDGGWGE